MITGRQVRAARSLLEWKAEDLAREAGLTRVTVSKIESGLVQPQEKTLAAIVGAFDKYGVEFLEDEGVKIRKHQIRVYSGKAGYKQFLDHIYYVVKNGGAICQFNASDGVYLPHADDYVADHLKRMGAIANLDARVLTVEGDYAFTAKYCKYRWLKKDQKVLMPYYVYNEFVEMPVYTSDNNIEVMSIHSKQLAEKFTQQFDLFWDSAIIPNRKKKAS
jgi:transcriptional regulator with XRE-family HTH domain